MTAQPFFFDDHNIPGHDILIGQGGDDDYDMEGGDDIGVAGPGIEKIAGASGYDWEIGQGDPQAQDMDLAQVFVADGVHPPAGVRDKFNEVEALSGWNLNDILRGDDVVPDRRRRRRLRRVRRARPDGSGPDQRSRPRWSRRDAHRRPGTAIIAVDGDCTSACSRATSGATATSCSAAAAAT